MSYYYNDIMIVIAVNFNNILLNEKSYKSLLIYNISYKNVMGNKTLHIRFHKIDGFNKIYNEIRYLVLLVYNEIYDKTKYLMNEKGGITDHINLNFERIRTGSCNSLPTKKYRLFIMP